MLAPEDELSEHYGPEQLGDHITDLTLAALGAAPSLADLYGAGESAKLTTNLTK